MKTHNDIDKYISDFPALTQKMLKQLRAIIQTAAPLAQEVISYKMPAYKINRILVYFAGYKNHIGFYPSSSPIIIYKDKLKEYKTSKGAIQFPLDKPLPVRLITQIIKFRIEQDSRSLKKRTFKNGIKGN